MTSSHLYHCFQEIKTAWTPRLHAHSNCHKLIVCFLRNLAFVSKEVGTDPCYSKLSRQVSTIYCFKVFTYLTNTVSIRKTEHLESVFFLDNVWGLRVNQLTFILHFYCLQCSENGQIGNENSASQAIHPCQTSPAAKDRTKFCCRNKDATIGYYN